ncbi:MAG TPA: alpha/beta hydrolase [Terriglobales bacterium]|nr:alpha/beta hydrolase [Terriglobales bacterium]
MATGSAAGAATPSPRPPVQARSITLAGARVRFQCAGQGPALLLVHGLLGYSFSWRHTIPALAERSTVYAPDLPGAGFSDPAPGMDYHLEACAERLLRFIEATGIENCDLVGTSHGGAVAIMTAALVPERIRTLILVAPVNPWSAHGRILSVLLSRVLPVRAFLGAAPELRSLQEFYFRRLYGDRRRIRPETIEGYLKPLLRRGPFQYALTVLRSWNRDLRLLELALPRVSQIPTLLVWGSRDGAVDPASAVPLGQQFADCQLRMLEGVGHLPYEEAPEDFNQAILGFLEGGRTSVGPATAVPAQSDHRHPG